MDAFLSKTHCDRCQKVLNGGRIMSMLNTDCICLDCKKAERRDPAYEVAAAAELEQIKKGNYNYEGLFGSPE